MRKTLTLTAAVLLAIGLVTSGTVLAQVSIPPELNPAVTRLAQNDSGQDDSLNLIIGAANNVIQACGGPAGGTEHIFDANADGIPDYAQMALVQLLINGGNQDVIDAYNAILAEVASQMASIYTAETPDADASEIALMNQAISLWLAIDLRAAGQGGMGDYASCLPPSAVGNRIAAAATALGADADVNDWVGAGADLDDDGRTNLEEWNWVARDDAVGAGKVLASGPEAVNFRTEVELWLDVATNADLNQDTFPEAGANVPVGTGLGLGLLALGIASGGAYIIRRKK